MLTDAEIVELELLLHQRNRDNLINSITFPAVGFANPNYIFLHDAIKNQKYDHFGKLLNGFRGAILEGSSRCFASKQKVITSLGNKKISEICPGDRVLTYNETKGKDEYCIVSENMSFNNNKKAVRVNLKNGNTIECTEDHEFFIEGAWVELKHVLSLWDARNRKEAQ